MIVQLTTFNCGGVAVAIKVAHSLADAQSLVQFVDGWAKINCATLAHTPIPPVSPIFDPLVLDQAAAGDIDAANPDPELIKAAHALPIRFFDPPRPADRCPPSITPLIQIPLSLKDLGAPVDHYLIYFSPKEVQRIWEEASSSNTMVVTHFDALASFVWSLMMRNRELEHDNQSADMSVTFNVRPRLSPALPEIFVGSPILFTCVAGKKSMSLQTLATSIRSSLAQFTPSNLSALLHAKAYEDNPQKLWAAFLKKPEEKYPCVWCDFLAWSRS
jgi:hypothetical protein